MSEAKGLESATPPSAGEPVVLTPEQAEAVCDVLIEMAQRLPLKRRNHEQALILLGWFERR